MAGDTDGALREIGRRFAVYERDAQRRQGPGDASDAARTAWQSRRVRRNARAGSSAGSAPRAPPAIRRSWGSCLALGGTLANLRGEYARASEYQREAETLGPSAREAAAQEAIPEGGTLVVAVGNDIVATEPTAMETVEEWEIYTNVFELLVTTGSQGDLVPALCERWEVRDQGRSFHVPIRSEARFQDGTPLTAESVKASFQRSIRKSARPAAGVRADQGRQGVPFRTVG